jgi:ligand-binding SRPBCC domain-containing protein
VPTVALTTRIQAPCERVWEELTRPHTHVRHSSARLRVQVDPPDAPLAPGTWLRYERRGGGPRLDWCAEVTDWLEGVAFSLRRTAGDLPQFLHRRELALDARGTRLRESIVYRAPGGPLAPWVDRWWLRDELIERLERSHRALEREALAWLRTESEALDSLHSHRPLRELAS